MQKNTIFRKSSLERVSSPEQLNEYIRVANPGVWIILTAVIVLLVGIVVWGIFGTVETNVGTGAVVKSGVATCYVGEADAAKISDGMKVTINGIEGSVISVSPVPTRIDETYDNTLMYFTGFNDGDFCYEVQVEVNGLDDGVFKANITVDSIHPIKFVIG